MDQITIFDLLPPKEVHRPQYMDGAKVLSLFDGRACGMLAMLEVGVKIDRYVAYEIDKYAVQTAQHNFPIIEHRGDVFHADFTEFDGFDWLVGGSPCTYWSIAQKNNRETEASGMGWELFSQYVRALNEAKPMFFIYENNKSMSKAIRQSITETFGFDAICINSALVSAQNRQRLYWVGKRNADGTYSRVDIEQPEDRGVLLVDVLERAVAINTTDNGNKAKTLMAGYYKYGTATLITNEGFKGGTTACAEPIATDIVPYVEKRLDKAVEKYGYLPEMWNPYNNAEITDKSPTLTTLSSQTASSTVFVYCFADPCEWDENGKPTKAISAADGKVYTAYEVKDGQITIKGKTYPIKLPDGFYIIRKLTVRECMRLQTVPEWYEFPVSDSQAYKMLGNGWTVAVISWLIRETFRK